MNFILRHRNDKRVIENSHQEQGKLCLTNLISLPFVEEERTENIIFPVLSKDSYADLQVSLEPNWREVDLEGG